MSRVVDCSNYLTDRSIERSIVTGTYENELLRKLGTRRAERVLLNLVHFSSENTRSRPEWWPSDVTFLATIEALRKETQEASEKWSQMLRNMLIQCNAFYKKRPVVGTKRARLVTEVRTRSAAKRRRVQPLKDVINLTFEQAVQTDDPASKHGKPSKPVSNVEKEKPIPCSRVQFMTFLDLKPVNSMFTQTKRADSEEQLKYTTNIPFSSDIGRKLVRREVYTLTKELYNRKTERLDYYMQENTSSNSNKEYEVSYTKKHTSDRLYNFPRRQHRQAKRYLQHLNDSLCKPLSVNVERFDVEDYMRKANGCRDVRVNLTRLTLKTGSLPYSDQCTCVLG